ncbi:hypothetical protein [Acetobacter orientalis]|uniref:hypothetical protein n=1 Tax=Acetobacter orientalis TaxID=146474 RepID=UPI00117885C7|nr:hypothetical protein [Acetobacter orientalis]
MMRPYIGPAFSKHISAKSLTNMPAFAINYSTRLFLKLESALHNEEITPRTSYRAISDHHETSILRNKINDNHPEALHDSRSFYYDAHILITISFLTNRVDHREVTATPYITARNQ